jgi:hypothetical protein
MCACDDISHLVTAPTQHQLSGSLVFSYMSCTLFCISVMDLAQYSVIKYSRTRLQRHERDRIICRYKRVSF